MDIPKNYNRRAVHLWFTAEIYERLRKRAYDEDRPVAAVCRDYILRGLDGPKKEESE